MKQFYFFILIIVLHITSCTEKETVAPYIKMDGYDFITNGVVFSSQKSIQSFLFQTNCDWSIIKVSQEGNNWAKISPVSGGSGDNEIEIEVEENLSSNDRNITLILLLESKEIPFNIIQKKSNKLDLSSDQFEVNAEGGQIEISFNTNDDFYVDIPSNYQDWIKYTTYTSESTTKILHFNILESEEDKERTGEIIITVNSVENRVKIIQKGQSIITLKKKNYEIDSNTHRIEVELTTNTTFNTIISDNDWITQAAQSRSISDVVLYFNVSENNTPNIRKGTIIFQDKKCEKSDTLTIVQAPKDVILALNAPGLLSNTINENQIKSASSIIISGQINGDDLNLLSKMSKENQLKKIDIYETEIVQGGNEFKSSHNTINSNLFYGCKLEEIILPKGLEYIEGYAFANSYSLKSVKTNDNIKSIGEGAFMDCSSLKEFIFPSKIRIIEKRCFWQCFNLENIVFPSCLEIIESEAFSNCKNLKELNLPQSLYSIGNESFNYCESIVKLIIPSSVRYLGLHAFFYCHNLIELNLPDGLETIDYGCFRQCESLQSVVLPKNLRTLGREAFATCVNLQLAIIPNTLSTIPMGVFFDCRSLKSIEIPNSVSLIEAEAFKSCKSLEEVILGENVSNIGNDSFSGTESLTKLISKAVNPPQISGMPFSSSTFGRCTLYVPETSLNRYSSSNIWNYFKNIKSIE